MLHIVFHFNLLLAVGLFGFVAVLRYLGLHGINFFTILRSQKGGLDSVLLADLCNRHMHRFILLNLLTISIAVVFPGSHPLWLAGSLALPFVYMAVVRDTMVSSLKSLSVDALFGTDRPISNADIIFADTLTSYARALALFPVALGTLIGAERGSFAHQLFHVYLGGILCLIPFWIRLRQCLSEAYLSRLGKQQYRHLANAAKYLLAMLCIVLTIALARPVGPAGYRLLSSLLRLCTVLSTMYMLYWDMVYDWGLLNRRLSVASLLPERHRIAMILISTTVRLVWLGRAFLGRGQLIAPWLNLLFIAGEVARRMLWMVLRVDYLARSPSSSSVLLGGGSVADRSWEDTILSPI